MLTLEQFILDSNRIEGIMNVSRHEVQAHMRFLDEPLSVQSVVDFVATIARQPLRDFPGMNVRVGNHIAPPGGPLIRPALEKILQGTDRHQVHLEYLTLHPFMDGNGRSARAIWLKMRGALPRIPFLQAFYYETLGAHDARHPL